MSKAGARLAEDFPELFSEAFDVWIPDGWYSLAYELCETIVRIRPEARVAQMKEKFAELRVYMAEHYGPVQTMIDVFEVKSRSTCQGCGGIGEQRSTKSGWVVTTCGKCFDVSK